MENSQTARVDHSRAAAPADLRLQQRNTSNARRPPRWGQCRSGAGKRRSLCEVASTGVAHGVADQVHHAGLHDRFGPDRHDRLRQCFEPVAARSARHGPHQLRSSVITPVQNLPK